jgi:peptidoglycan/LPS O-acetylase OafA/YrhL
METDRLSGLDAFRGVAALMVLGHHLVAAYHFTGLNLGGVYAVDAFFVLSGYVIGRVYEPRFDAGMTFFAFMKSRYRRLVLPALIGSILGLSLLLLEYGPSPTLLLALPNLAFLPAPIPDNAFILNYPLWSLFIELVANALHAAVLRRLTRTHLVWLVIALSLVVVPLTLHSGEPLIGVKLKDMPAAMLRGVACYTIGLILWRSPGITRLVSQVVPAKLAIFGFPVAVVGLASALPSSVTEVAVMFFIAPVLSAGSLSLPWSRWAAGLGSISYPLYAVHGPLSDFNAAVGIPVLQSFTIILSAAVLVALVCEPSARKRRGRVTMHRAE